MGQPHRVWEGTTQDMQSPGVHLRGSGPLLLGVGLVRQAPEGQLKPTRPLPSLLLPPSVTVPWASSVRRGTHEPAGRAAGSLGSNGADARIRPRANSSAKRGPRPRPSRARPTCHVGLPERRVDSGQETTGRLLGVFTLTVSRHSSVTWS